jgi:predicted acetyltransferase
MIMNKYNDYTSLTSSYVEAWDGKLWKLCNPTPDASVPNFTAHHPDGHILCGVYETHLMRVIKAFELAQVA